MDAPVPAPWTLEWKTKRVYTYRAYVVGGEGAVLDCVRQPDGVLMRLAFVGEADGSWWVVRDRAEALFLATKEVLERLALKHKNRAFDLKELRKQLKAQQPARGKRKKP